MMGCNSIKILYEATKKCQLIGIFRERFDEYKIQGIPLLVGKSLLLIEEVYDFDLNGYKIMRLEDLTNIIRNEVDQFHEKIMRREEIYQKVIKPNISKLNNWFEVIQQLYKLNKVVEVECESLYPGEIYIGQIKKVDEIYVYLRTFDPLCCWDKDILKIKHQDITTITFDDRYSTTLSKYCHE